MIVLVVGLLAVAALTGWGIVQAVRTATQPAADLTGNLATRAAQVIQPTPTVFLDAPAVVRAVSALARLETAAYTIEKVIRAEEGQGALAVLFGDRLLFVAHGVVVAGLDLSKLGEADVTVTPDGRAILTLPRAEVFSATLDNQKSYVYDRDIGLFTHGNIHLETLARQQAETAIRDAALEDGILDLAQQNGERYLERLLESLGFKGVVFVTATAAP